MKPNSDNAKSIFIDCLYHDEEKYMTPEELPFKPLVELCRREGCKLYIKEDGTFGILPLPGKVGMLIDENNAQFGRRVREILANTVLDNDVILCQIIEESQK